MRRIPFQSKFVLGLTLVLFAACGGGGGGGGPGLAPGGGLPPPAGDVLGRLTFLSGAAPLVIEREPNNDFGSAQTLGDYYPGQTATVLGTLDTAAGADVFDAFRVRLPTRSTVRLTTRFGLSNDYDLGIYDPVGMQFVAVFDIPVAPETHVVHLKGTFDLVLIGNSGQGNYELEIAVERASVPLPEREPNDAASEAQYIGELAVLDSVVLGGTAHASTDPVDAFLVACPERMDLSASLVFPSFQDFDVRILDATTDVGAATLIQAFEGPGSPPQTGMLPIPAGTLLLIEVRATTGNGLWQLTLTGAAPAAPKPASKVAAAVSARAPAALSLESASLGHGQEHVHYGFVGADIAPGEALVCFHDEVGDRAEGEAHLARCGGQIALELPGIACKVDLGLSPDLPELARRRLTISRTCATACADCVRYSEPNRFRRASLVPNDTYYELQWHYDLINLPAAWDITTGSNDTIVAIIDTGRTSHPDVAGRYIAGYDMVSLLQYAGDGDGPDANPEDLGVQTSYHGTHVAGTIGATSNNNLGVAGVTWATRLMPLRALGNYGVGTDFDVAAAILYAARLPNSSGALPAERADVINMSLGGPGFGQTMGDATAAAIAAGVTVVASAGNDNTAELFYPASYDGVISVSAVDPQRARAPYSSFGPAVDIAAPGGNSFADLTGDGYVDGVLSTVGDQSYEFLDGTSMAAPHISGVAALLIGLNPALTPDQVELVLTTTALDLGTPGRDDFYGHGLVDAFAAVKSVGGTEDEMAPPNLVVSPDALNFGVALPQLDIRVFNLGGGFVTVTGVQLLMDDGETWLAAETFGPGDASRNVDGIRVSVDRAALPTRSYFATLRILTDAGNWDIPVAMSKAFQLPPPPDIDIHIFAVSIETGEVAGEVIVNPSVSLDFIFGGLVAGEYLFIASTDVDGDGIFDENGEFRGAWPLTSSPQSILVVANVTIVGLNFTVEPNLTLGGAGTSRR